MKKCSGCDQEKVVIARGLCNACYCRQRYWKDPDKARNMAVSYSRSKRERRKAYDKSRREHNLERDYEKRRSPEFRAKSRAIYHANKDRYKTASAKYRYKPEFKFSCGRSQAIRRDLEWGLDLETFKSLVARPCHYCGSDLHSNKGVCLDRKDNSKGYFVENVLPCCGDCNKIRIDKLTVKEMEVAMNAILWQRLALTKSALEFV